MNLGELDEAIAKIEYLQQLMEGTLVKADEGVARLPKMEGMVATTQQLTRLLYRLGHLLTQMGLPPEAQEVIAKLQQIVFLVRMLHMSISFLEKSTWYGMLMGAMGFLSVGFSGYDMMRGS